MVSFHVAKKKDHTIDEKLIKPCIDDIASLLLPENEAAKLKQISLSSNAIGRRINEMSTDILDQTILKIKCSEISAIQLDESTDVSNLAQLMVFARYFHSDTLEERVSVLRTS